MTVQGKITEEGPLADDRRPWAALRGLDAMNITPRAGSATIAGCPTRGPSPARSAEATKNTGHRLGVSVELWTRRELRSPDWRPIRTIRLRDEARCWSAPRSLARSIQRCRSACIPVAVRTGL
jgi:hypothetical protein